MRCEEDCDKSTVALFINRRLDDDYPGIIVTTMIHKIHDAPASQNASTNIYVLIDEAHRTTGGDPGIFLGAGNVPEE